MPVHKIERKQISSQKKTLKADCSQKERKKMLVHKKNTRGYLFTKRKWEDTAYCANDTKVQKQIIHQLMFMTEYWIC